MRRWRKTVNIKQFLSDDGSPENAAKVASQIATLLKAECPLEVQEDDELSEIVEWMECISADDDDACDILNGHLDDLYNWADTNRVWMGL